MRNGNVGAALGALLIAALIWSCGGGESTTATLGKAQFLKQASRLCVKAEAVRGAVVSAAGKEVPKGGEVSKAELEDVVAEALKPYKTLPNELRELGSPKGDEKRAEEIVVALEKSVQQSESEPGSAISGAAFREFNRLVTAYGLDRCSI